jgi:hypothetical protein
VRKYLHVSDDEDDEDQVQQRENEDSSSTLATPPWGLPVVSFKGYTFEGYEVMNEHRKGEVLAADRARSPTPHLPTPPSHKAFQIKHKVDHLESKARLDQTQVPPIRKVCRVRALPLLFAPAPAC